MLTLFLHLDKTRGMNLKHEIEQCLASRKWTPHRLAKEAGLASDMGIRRVLSGEREGLHSKNLCKLLPFFSSPTQPDRQES